MTQSKQPPESAVNEALRNPGGWVYQIGGGLNPNDSVPPEAIAGAWQVDDTGRIVGEFIPNPRYDSARFPGT